MTGLARLTIAGSMVPTSNWLIYRFVRKETVATSQLEGTQATLRDIVAFETTKHSDHTEDVGEVCSYVTTLEHARAQISAPNRLPFSIRLLCAEHRFLMAGVHGESNLPRDVRQLQNWISGSRPGNAQRLKIVCQCWHRNVLQFRHDHCSLPYLHQLFPLYHLPDRQLRAGWSLGCRFAFTHYREQSHAVLLSRHLNIYTYTSLFLPQKSIT